jgi:hypothetical protein
MTWTKRILIFVFILFFALIAGKYKDIKIWHERRELQRTEQQKVQVEQEKLTEVKVEKKEISISEDCWK